MNTFAPPYLPKLLNLSSTANETNFALHAAVHPKSENTDTSPFVKYMLHKPLTKIGLTKFNEKLENYRDWTSKLKVTIGELHVTTTENKICLSDG